MAWLGLARGCLAGDASFSADGQRIYAILAGEQKPMLREIERRSRGGSGWGVLLQLLRPPSRAEEQKAVGVWAIPVLELARDKELLQGLKSLSQADRPESLCAAPDGARVYYTVNGKDYLVTNGKS